MTKVVKNIAFSKSKNEGPKPLLLDTLAQLRKEDYKNDKQKLLRKARSKYFTTKLAIPLAELKK